MIEHRPLIVVSAVEHPEPDDWVWEQAREAADRARLILGVYRGREDVAFPAEMDLCCHVFEAMEPAA